MLSCQALLHHAMDTLASGRMSEKELEHMLLTQLKVSCNNYLGLETCP